MAGREQLDVGLPVAVEGLDLRGEDHQAVAPRPEERLDADRVTGGDAVAVGRRGEERVHATEPRQRGRALAVDQVKRDLVVRGAAEAGIVERATDVLVVVELAVSDEPPGTVAGAERLGAALEVDDRQPAVPEPCIADTGLPLTVGAPVDEALEHASAERLGKLPGGSGRLLVYPDDSTHIGLRAMATEPRLARPARHSGRAWPPRPGTAATRS